MTSHRRAARAIAWERKWSPRASLAFIFGVSAALWALIIAGLGAVLS